YGEFGERSDTRGTGHTDTNGTRDALRAERCRPAQDRIRLEAELGHQRYVEATLACECHFSQQCRIERVRVDRGMAFGITREGNAFDSVAFDHAGRQQVETGAERAGRA